jgi:membrane protein
MSQNPTIGEPSNGGHARYEKPIGGPLSSEAPRNGQLVRAHEQGRGRNATNPLKIPPRGGRDILWRTYEKINADRLLYVSGGVAFFALLAIFPALGALVSAYGIFFNPATITNNLALIREAVPGEVLNLLSEQAQRMAANGHGTLSVGVIIGILLSLWSAMGGVKATVDALNVIYEEKESRSFIRLNVVSLLLTLAGFSAFLLAVVGVVVLPIVLSFIGLGSATAVLTKILRWPALLFMLLIELAVLYRYGPDRRMPRWEWVSAGSVFAALVWIAGSYLFSWYLSNFANYNATYGSLGAAAGFMTWLWISASVILLGAALNAEIEHQTARDSTTGEEKPLGQRGAEMADTLGKRTDE